MRHGIPLVRPLTDSLPNNVTQGPAPPGEPGEPVRVRRKGAGQDLQRNRSSPISIVAACTAKFDETLYPTEVLMSARGRTGLSVDSVVLLNQLRSVDKKKLVKRLGKLSGENLAQVDRALRISLGLVEL